MTEAEPAPEPAPAPVAEAAPEPEPAPAWQPPDTFSEKFSRGSAKLIRFLVVTSCIVFLLGVVLWVIPTVVVANSADYAVATQSVENDRGLRSYLGAPLICETVPSRYAIHDDGGSYAFLVQGGYGRAVVQVEVKDGKVVNQRVHHAIDWTQPLAGQLPELSRD